MIVEKGHYYEKDYDDMERFISYFEQIRLAKKYSRKDSKILEIGIGNKTTFNYLKQHKYDIKSLDIVKEIEPDYNLDISKNLPFKINEFDIVLCFQTLEHMPFEDAILSLKNMRRISKVVILSLPYRRIIIGTDIKLPFFQKRGFYINLPHFLKRKEKGQHDWEIGDKGYSLKEFRKKLINLKFKIVEEYSNPLCLYKHFFVLKK